MITKTNIKEVLCITDEILAELEQKCPEVYTHSLENLVYNLKRLKNVGVSGPFATSLAFINSRFVFGDPAENESDFNELIHIKNYFSLTPPEVCNFLKNNDQCLTPNLLNSLQNKYLSMVSSYPLTRETAIKILVNTSVYTNDELFFNLGKNIKVLKNFGYDINKLKGNVFILNNSPETIETKLKLATICDISYSTFFKNAYKYGTKVIYARLKAQKNGLIPHLNSPYCREKPFFEGTTLTTDDLIELYPLNNTAIREIDRSFYKKNPTLAQKILGTKCTSLCEAMHQEQHYIDRLIKNRGIKSSTISYFINNAGLDEKAVFSLFCTYNINEQQTINLLTFLTQKLGFYKQDIKRLILFNPSILNAEPTQILRLFTHIKKVKQISIKEFKENLINGTYTMDMITDEML